MKINHARSVGCNRWNKWTARGLRSPYLLSGLIACGRCGSNYQGRTIHSTKRRKDGSYRDIAHPLNSDMRRYLEETIFREYDELVASSQRDPEGWEADGDRDQAGAPGAPESLAAGPAEGEGHDRLMT